MPGYAFRAFYAFKKDASPAAEFGIELMWRGVRDFYIKRGGGPSPLFDFIQEFLPG